MNKLAKVIYVDESSDEPIFFTSAEECAVSGETRTLAVYKLSGKIEVSTQMKEEIVIKKPPKKTAAKVPEIEPMKGEMLLRPMPGISSDTSRDA